MERYTMFLDWKNQYCENDCTTQSNLQIKHNPYQITNGIFYRTRTNNLKICMETQETPNIQNNLENRARRIRSLTSDYITKPQWPKQYGTSTKTDTYIIGTEQIAQKSTHTLMVNEHSTKEARIYSGEKTVSSISGLGKLDSYM